MHESAGERHPVTARHGNKWLTAMLVEAAGSVGRIHGANCLAAQHARLTARRGMGRPGWRRSSQARRRAPADAAWRVATRRPVRPLPCCGSSTPGKLNRSNQSLDGPL